jgi:hypothetical protein
MLILNPTYLLLALPSWLVSVYLLRLLSNARKSAAKPMPAMVEVKGKG